MAKNFDTEIRESFDKKYLKVFLKNISIIEEVQEQLSKLQSVKNVNITDSKSKNNPSLTLTVYPNRVRIYQRNVLDDMRLSLETFLKEILKNQKSLENQLSEVGKFQKEKGLSPEFISMFNRLLDYYAKYQNNYVKHNDAVKYSEIDFVINLTTLFMKSFM